MPEGREVRIWSSGIPGYNTLQEAHYLEKHIGVEADLVVLGFCLNDFLPSMVVVAGDRFKKGDFAFSKIDPLGDVSPFLFEHSVLYRHIKMRSVDRGNPELYSPETIRRHRALVRQGLRDEYAALGLYNGISRHGHLMLRPRPQSAPRDR